MRKILVFLCLFFIITSCVSYKNYYKLDKDYLAKRQYTTKRLDIKDKNKVILASVQVLQDLGFQIDETEKELGLITATKDTKIGSIGRTIGMFLLMVFVNSNTRYDVRQKIYVTLLVKNSNSKGVETKATFARVVWNNFDEKRIEKINDKKIYKNFFEKLEQSLFLTENNI